MAVWEVVDNCATVDGDDLVLSRIENEWAVHTGPTLLMSSEAHYSEDMLARITLGRHPQARRVLVGGLGMGFTLRATLDHLPSDAQVVLAETSNCMVRWNRTHLGYLAGDPLADPRVTLKMGDVAERIDESCEEFDAILLDVDNGPHALVHAFNDSLYGPRGSKSALRALKPGGALAVWSRWPVDEYTQRLADAGFQTEMLSVQLPDEEDGTNTIFLAFKPLAGRAQVAATAAEHA
ncbi:MAG: hypothetical protein RL385_4248 [Pseudomonadota bacterium]|jgi:spermidine synthase